MAITKAFISNDYPVYMESYFIRSFFRIHICDIIILVSVFIDEAFIKSFYVYNISYIILFSLPFSISGEKPVISHTAVIIFPAACIVSADIVSAVGIY